MVEESNLATTKQLSLSTMFATTAQVDTVQLLQVRDQLAQKQEIRFTPLARIVCRLQRN